VKKGEATRLRILVEAERQAATRGILTVSLNDVADAVALSKSGLFKHFDSKEAMQLAVLEYAADRFVEMVWRPNEHLPAGRARLEGVFERWLDWGDSTRGGCLLAAASVELDDQPGALRDLLQFRLQRWHRTLTREMQALRDPPIPEDEARAAAYQMKSYMLGQADMARFLDETDSRAVARAAFKGLLDRTAATLTPATSRPLGGALAGGAGSSPS
jgi:AcrR family transcriptional regulator